MIYKVWENMMSRCYSESYHAYHRYGGRGIKVCPEWHTFANFFRDMNPRPSKAHTLDRINNDGDYELSNCRWATSATQMSNKTHNQNRDAQGRFA